MVARQNLFIATSAEYFTGMTPIPDDPVIDEIREVRHRISERCGHDAQRLVAYYMALQEQYRDRLIRPPERMDPLST
jgi:hypothetical protein